MKTYVCTLTLPDGNKVVAKARAASMDDEVPVEWSGAVDRLGQIVLGRHSVGFFAMVSRSALATTAGKS